MNSFFRLFCLTGLSMIAISAYAVTSGTGNFDATPKALNQNLSFGNWNLGTTGSLSRDEGNFPGTTDFFIAVTAKYFVADRLAVGLLGDWSISSRYPSRLSLGAAGDYYFWTNGATAALVGLSHEFQILRPYRSSTSAARVGMRYFFSPTVAFGPNLFYREYWHRRTSDSHSYGIDFGFDIYL